MQIYLKKEQKKTITIFKALYNKLAKLYQLSPMTPTNLIWRTPS